MPVVFNHVKQFSEPLNMVEYITIHIGSILVVLIKKLRSCQQPSSFY